MGKYYDRMVAPPQSVGPGVKGGNVPLTPMGEDWDPSQPEPKKSYYNALVGNTEMRQGQPSFMENPTSNVSPIDERSKMAGVADQAIASLPTDIKERAAYFASQRFPDDPNGAARYGVRDGRLFYLADDGKAYFEEPKLSFSQADKYVASSAGPMLPVGGSIIGGVSTAPMGGAPGAALGAAAGDEMRQVMAMGLAGQKDFRPMQTAKEAVLGGVGQGIGAGGARVMNRQAARDISQIQTPEAQALIKSLQDKAAQEGVDLTPAELTDLKSLRGQQNYLGDSSRSADTMADFYQRRNQEQVPDAINNMLGKISPTDSIEVGAKNLQEGGAATIKAEMAERSAAAQPFYDKSRNTVITSDDYKTLMKDPFIRQQMKAVMRDPKYQADIGDLMPKKGGGAPADAKVGFLDVVKRRIDGMIADTKNPNDRRIYQQAKNKLLTIADNASPDYAKARGIFEAASPPVTDLTKGAVGLVAKKGPTQLRSVPRTMFEAGPDAVGRNRSAYIKAGKEQEWNDGLRAYLQESMDKASKEFVSGNANPGMRFRSLVFGTGQQKLAMQRAMSPEQWAGFNRLMDVLEATGRVAQGGSRTEPLQQIRREMESEALGVSGKAIENLVDIPGIPRRLGQFTRDMMMGRHSEKLAGIITSPDALKQLKQLKALSPRSQKAMAIVSQVLAQYGAAPSAADAEPGTLSDGSANPRAGR